MIAKLDTAMWFLQRPTHWRHAADIARRKWRPDHDGPAEASRARGWAAERAVPLVDVLATMGLATPETALPRLPASLIKEAQDRAARSLVKMGGAGDVNLLYAATILLGARRVVETGVAYGWSSLAILAAIDGQEGARLVSVDMPYPKMNNEAFVGIVVPDRFRRSWDLIREPDRPGLKKAIAKAGGTIDLCHYDSDKSWWGRQYGYPLLWAALRPGGIFISDDIQDNMAFADFAAEHQFSFSVTEYGGKYIGVIRK
jgi:predicted O-methyltransferase YrrM